MASAEKEGPWTPGLRSPYVPNLAAYSLVVGLCAAIALAPVLQRSAWLFPMPGSRSGCQQLGRYESLRTEVSLADLAGRDGAALAYARASQSHEAVADCLASTTTRWLPLYGLGRPCWRAWAHGPSAAPGRESDLAT
ncbi:hypothetical protein [Streptomyces sp. 6N106]|uniref:hypothetical protein n=1 Tax=Streptomyces sp. 6N106 TaxID=3457418 RepID=UPI003FD405F7